MIMGDYIDTDADADVDDDDDDFMQRNCHRWSRLLNFGKACPHILHTLLMSNRGTMVGLRSPYVTDCQEGTVHDGLED